MFRVANDIVLDLTDVSSDERSEILDCTNVYLLSAQAVSTGTVSAVLKVEVSNDKVNFVELASPTATVSGAGSVVLEKADLAFKYARMFLDVTSGTTNTVKVYITTKGI